MKPEDSANVCEVEQSKLVELDLAEATKKILASLPRMCVLSVSFSSEKGTFPTLNEYCQSNGLPHIAGGEMLYRIGTDEGSQICLTRGVGHVIAVDPKGAHKQRFVNSDIALFLEVLELYRQYSVSVRSKAEDEAVVLVAQTVDKMREMDPDAFSDSDSWWPCVADQMEFGML